MIRPGNKERVERDAASIAQAWITGQSDLSSLCKTYRATQRTIVALILTRITREQYRKIARQHQITANAGGAKRLTVKVWTRCQSRKSEGFGRRGKVRRCRYIKVEAGQDRARRGKWISLAQYLWEKVHGRPVPPGYIVAHADGKTMNDDPSNLVLRSRAEQARLAVRSCDQEKRGRKISKTKKENFAIAKRMQEAMAQRAARGPDVETDDWFDDEEVA